MYKQDIHTREHSLIKSFTEEELVCLQKEKNRLITHINLTECSCRTGNHIGLSWIIDRKKILYVTPKLDNESSKINYLEMLDICFRFPETFEFTDDLFKIYFDEPSIKIRQQQDIITPLLVFYYLQLVHAIVKKGLKKGYYPIKKKLQSSIKGKILVADTLKHYTFKNKSLDTLCSYDEFGLNNQENRIIKKALLFVLRYISGKGLAGKEQLKLIRYILSAFEKIDSNITLKEIKSIRPNPFFSEYTRAVEIALLILKRYGFNINRVSGREEVEVPPFWIDMARLFELYVLGKLKKSFGRNEIIFQAKGKYGALDFLRVTKGKEMIIDAKYKTLYRDEKSQYDINDIKQLSAYSRDKGILQKLSLSEERRSQMLLNCLVIYPDQSADEFIDPEGLFRQSIDQFEGFYKLGISIPTIPHT